MPDCGNLINSDSRIRFQSFSEDLRKLPSQPPNSGSIDDRLYQGARVNMDACESVLNKKASGVSLLCLKKNIASPYLRPRLVNLAKWLNKPFHVNNSSGRHHFIRLLMDPLP